VGDEVRRQHSPEERAQSDAADRALLARHAAGDRDAFGELFQRHRDRLWSVALRTTGDPEEAADALQDAMVNAFRAADRFRSEAAVGTWLYRIVVNACIDRIRRNTSRPTVQYPHEQSPGWERAVRDPSDMAANRDLRIVLEQALAELPADQRAAVVAVDVGGLPVEEAAAALGVPVGTVKSRCARGRARLAVALAEFRNQSPVRPVRTMPADEAYLEQQCADSTDDADSALHRSTQRPSQRRSKERGAK
jgi:RNA polymerase sigma-70 factor, ECF subfamily